MRWDYPPLDINLVFPGLGKIVIIIIIIIYCNYCIIIAIIIIVIIITIIIIIIIIIIILIPEINILFHLGKKVQCSSNISRTKRNYKKYPPQTVNSLHWGY